MNLIKHARKLGLSELLEANYTTLIEQKDTGANSDQISVGYMVGFYTTAYCAQIIPFMLSKDDIET